MHQVESEIMYSHWPLIFLCKIPACLTIMVAHKQCQQIAQYHRTVFISIDWEL